MIGAVTVHVCEVPLDHDAIERLHEHLAFGAVYRSRPAFDVSQKAWVQTIRDREGQRSVICANEGDELVIKHIPFVRAPR